METASREMTLKEWVEKLPEGHKARKEFDELCSSEQKLCALESCGVDNWTGYDDAMEALAEWNK